VDFDYSDRIVLKKLIGFGVRKFHEVNGVFTPVTVDRCENCQVEGIIKGKSFFIDDMPKEDIEWTLTGMGIRRIDKTDFELMPTLEEDCVLCEHCKELEYEE